MFFGLLDPDPLVRGMDPDPDPSIISKNSKKNVNSYCFVTFYDLSLKNDVNIVGSGAGSGVGSESVSQRYGPATGLPTHLISQFP